MGYARSAYELGHKKCEEFAGHRDHISDWEFPANLAVAIPIHRRDRRLIPEARAATDKEWEKLRCLGDGGRCWDEDYPEEWSVIAQRARDAGETVHFGFLDELCM